MYTLYKYPRTPHLDGSRFQPGDEDLRVVSLEHLAGRHLVVEEKLDGANSAVSFGDDGRLLLQSRGHFLDGGPREKHFGLLKAWATSVKAGLWDVLGSRFVMYGEWLYAKHTIFYDDLLHYFFEFDVLDKSSGRFLSTRDRRELLDGAPVLPAPVLYSGEVRPASRLESLITPSAFQTSSWREALVAVCESKGLDAGRALRETDPAGLMEGLYVKVEDGERVVGRFKFVRESFRQAVDDSGEHWLNRPVIPNRLREGVDLFAPRT
ncbi:MAG TPA: RNA ligase family protein [Pyrinomonadaceae bacterium]|nr:RNA ligase family protein [Pyrinomonadaceae bacterium]